MHPPFLFLKSFVIIKIVVTIISLRNVVITILYSLSTYITLSIFFFVINLVILVLKLSQTHSQHF